MLVLLIFSTVSKFASIGFRLNVTCVDCLDFAQLDNLQQNSIALHAMDFDLDQYDRSYALDLPILKLSAGVSFCGAVQ